MKLKYNDWHLFTYLTKYIRPYLWLLILASIALISNLLSSLIRPYLSKQVIDLGFAMKDLNFTKLFIIYLWAEDYFSYT